MFRRIGPFVALLLLIGGASWGIHAWRYRFVHDNGDLFGYLPDGSGSTFFADLKQVREGGFVSLLAGTRGALKDPEYEEFVRQTGFDYTRDLDTVVAKNGSVPVLVARGRFDWARLGKYAQSQNSSKNKRQITFEQIQPDVIFIKTGSVPISRGGLARVSASKKGTDPVLAPVWLRLAPEVIAHPGELPFPLPIFAISLGAAQDVVLSLVPAAEASGSALVLNLNAKLPNSAAAQTIRTQLEIETRMVALALAREHQAPDAASLTGLLTAGRFESAGTTVRGSWPVRNELLRALTY